MIKERGKEKDMDKEMSSFVAMGLMFLANIAILFARNKLKGIPRIIVSTFAFLLLIPSLLLILVVLL
ncbi:DUF2768 family protein [Ammoniphilus sp. CFH 90114]|uniref:DUF2768 family protein n=1 Tax=Ammoniphilus sp. CFH 90114 TaxID=2493665 RepID=UPI001F0C0531|nr:DUF2768 family protein [Ammoniphilus sp. CFH 90114]